MKNKKISITLMLVLIALVGTAYAKTVRIAWDPIRLAPESIAPGETRSFSVNLKNTGLETFETEHIGIVLSGDVASMMTARKPVFPKKIKRGESVSVVFDVTVPSTAPMSVLRGTVVLAKQDDDRGGEHKGRGRDKNAKEVVSDALPVELTVSSIALPPDPGEAGKKDVLGIDSDANGVRDDIDRYIVFTYPDSEKTRMALSQYAQEEQIFLRDSNDKQKSIENSRLIERSMNCLSYIFRQDINQWFDMTSLLDAELLNTPERSRMEIRANSHLGGQGGGGSSDEENKAACTIDPDTLPN